MNYLQGLHDRESVQVAAPGTWALDTIALSENPAPSQYPTSLNWIGRLNWNYGSSGTLPHPDRYGEMAQRAAVYVAGSHGCHRWIVGNEPNLPREWPDGEAIYPWHYAACFKLVRNAIRALPGHGRDEVLIAASGPWNAQCQYEGNADGDWIIYFLDQIDLLGAAFDGFSLHSYTHGYNVGLVTSTKRMDAPFTNRYYNFLTYRDYCNNIPIEFKHLPTYITEANGDGPWQAVGLIPAMLAEIDTWNRAHNEPQISCLCFFRYPADKDDGYGMADKPAVMAEYSQALQGGYYAPEGEVLPGPGPEPEPEPTPPPQPSPAPDLQWDKRLDVRGCDLTAVAAEPGQTVWRCVLGRWFNEQEAQGRVNTFVTLLDEQGQLVSGVPVTWYWQSGEDTKPSEVKNDPWLGHPYSKDFTMYNVAPSYGVRIADGNPTDIVWGMGLGSIEQPDYKIHTAYEFIFQRVQASQPQPPIAPGPGIIKYVTPLIGANMRAEPVDGAVLIALPVGSAVEVYGSVTGDDGYAWDVCLYQGLDGFIRADLLSLTAPQPPEPPLWEGLVHPLPGARITQHFYQNRENYEQWGLAGHDGTDFGGKALGTPILAMAEGAVVEVAYDAEGYGHYVRLYHEQLDAQTLYCHASEIKVAVGQRVAAGQTIALVGSSGNSTGAHLHLEVRAVNPDGTYRKGTPMAKGRIDPQTWAFLYGLTL